MTHRMSGAFATLALLATTFAAFGVQAQTTNPNEHQFQKQDARIVMTTGGDNVVDVHVTGSDLPTVVLVRDEDGNWADMRRVAASDGSHWRKEGYNIAMGNHVWFEFGWSVPKDFIQEKSCAYEHRGFTKHCELAEPPLPPVDLRFDHVGGNEWWVEVQMLGKSVESLGDWIWARDDQGDSIFLDRRAPGRYADSLRVPIGTRVNFEAHVPHRDPVLSCWFVHNSGEEKCDGWKVAPLMRARDTWPDGQMELRSSHVERFEHVKVSEWWTEANIVPEPGNPHWSWTTVQMRVNGGTWKDMTLRSWGAHAASVHVPTGGLVQFRAYDAKNNDWHYTVSSWSRANPSMVVPSQDAPWQVQFNNVKGNNWWVQVNPSSDEYFQRVQARVEGGPWKELSFRDWGDWAASFNVPTGKRVQFQAIQTDWDGTVTKTVQSGFTTWPPPA